MTRILLADDDPQILRALSITLRAHGYEVTCAKDGAEAVRAAVGVTPDLVMVDLGMPEMTGLEVIEAIRGWSQVPILVVSGRTESSDKVTALDLGADDYVTKPFSTDELLARIRALTRRGSALPDAPATVDFGVVRVDRAATQIVNVHTGRPIHLTPTEWKILDVLLDNPGRLVTRSQIFTALWGENQVADTGYLRLYISQLRKKLEPDQARPRHLLTEPGMGYRLVIE
ncbi:response regulator transcription factor [Devriesea agamarum]|uniref:response regulator transcription factor n=1 Tax=Devriesea agamarum TaxID=472569 RepID=UPI00071DDD62|nr:response regulator transcription factor [Devriesea agamarum]